MRVKVKVKGKEHCNLCGKELDFWDGTNNISINKYLGYGSLHDGSIINMRLCCDCIDRLVDACAISPVVKEGLI